jgi:hypothetical protein
MFQCLDHSGDGTVGIPVLRHTIVAQFRNFDCVGFQTGFPGWFLYCGKLFTALRGFVHDATELDRTLFFAQVVRSGFIQCHAIGALDGMFDVAGCEGPGLKRAVTLSRLKSLCRKTIRRKADAGQCQRH